MNQTEKNKENKTKKNKNKENKNKIKNLSNSSDFLKNSYTIYVCGVGGQGIIKTSTILAEAGMKEGHNVVTSEIHGMSQRGGVVSTEVKIGDYKSSIIENNNANMILSFEPIETIRGLDKGNKNTKLIFNTTPLIPPNINSQEKDYPKVDTVTNILKRNYPNSYPIDGNKLAIESGNILSLNMVLLGATIASDGFPLSRETVIEVMKENLNEKFHEMNLKAINLGYNAMQKQKKA
ncbi:indolepyruvate oxidoreductase subunit beta [Methanobrevibacter curvatus]|uniref:Indolepyruvate oxidoreductase subunit beta n=1 Tax=Methanobrevibacter curvatus TaxID=49547 RepID=A0A166AKD0_9EURY|nr:indolepyruvate oxidoreductase subunit beta [Methanobrevibacter curvatus]KZX12148.1 indolepyruvate oxidoreductase subunit beta [Methanobrevibacter curvatus]